MSLKRTLIKKASQGILIASGVWFGIRNYDMFEEIKKQTLEEYRPKTKEELNIYSIETFITNNIYENEKNYLHRTNSCKLLGR